MEGQDRCNNPSTGACVYAYASGERVSVYESVGELESFDLCADLSSQALHDPIKKKFCGTVCVCTHARTLEWKKRGRLTVLV